MTLRDLYNITAAARGHWVITGTPKRIADTLEEWFLAGRADGFMILPAYFPGAFDEYGRAVLKSRIDELIEVSPAEAESFSCNAVVVGKTIILNDGAPQLANSLRDLGFDVRPHQFTEFIKAGGSAKCLTLRLDGEEAATWGMEEGEKQED